jgi:hypothetical protein
MTRGVSSILNPQFSILNSARERGAQEIAA